MDQPAHRLTSRRHDFLVGDILSLIEVQKFILKNIVGQLGAYDLDPLLSQIALFGIGGPDHHVDMRVVLLVVVGGAPAELAGWNFHGLSQFRLVSQQKLAPALAVLVPQPRGVLPLQRVDEGPHRSVVSVDLLHGLL